MQRKELLEKLAQIISNIRSNGPLLIGIDGVDGAGKTMLANELVSFIETKNKKVARASIDGFHNSREIRIGKGPLSPEGYFEDSFDYESLVHDFLEPLQRIKEPTRLRSAKHDWKTESTVSDKSIEVDENTIVLFEGVFLFRPELEDFWDYKIYLQIRPETSLQRGLARDSRFLGGEEATREKYLQRYIPGQRIYHEKYDPEQRAHIVINNNDPMNPEIQRE